MPKEVLIKRNSLKLVRSCHQTNEMNLTILQLHLYGLVAQKSLNMPILSLYSSLAIIKCDIRRSFFPFINSYPLRLHVKDSRFQNFLSQAIRITDLSVKNKVIRLGRARTIEHVCQCTNTIFMDCITSYGEGGAIYATSMTIFRNCLFQKCQSQNGGAVYSGSDIDYLSTTFNGCIGLQSAGCIYAHRPKRLIISFCSFGGCAATDAGGLKSFSYNNEASFRYSNFTAVQAMRRCGGIDIGYSDTQFLYVVFDQCFGRESIAGIYLYNQIDFVFNDCIFLACYTDGQSDEGVAIHIYDASGEPSILRCAFYQIRRLVGYSVVAIGDVNISISKCCFTLSKLGEVQGPFIIDDDSLFEQQCQTHVMFILPRYMGYLGIENETPKPFLESLFSETAMHTLSKTCVPMMFIGLGIGWIISLFLKKTSRRHHRHRIREIL